MLRHQDDTIIIVSTATETKEYTLTKTVKYVVLSSFLFTAILVGSLLFHLQGLNSKIAQLSENYKLLTLENNKNKTLIEHFTFIEKQYEEVHEINLENLMQEFAQKKEAQRMAEQVVKEFLAKSAELMAQQEEQKLTAQKLMDKKLTEKKLVKQKIAKKRPLVVTKKPKSKKRHLASTKIFKNYSKFKANTNLRKSFKIFKDNALLKKANGRNTKLKIDISEQRVRLYVNNRVALDSPCTTGAKRKFEPNTRIYRDKRTPKGSFKITEKISDKRSTIFGKYYRNGKLVYTGDKRKYRGSKRGLKYKGASLKNWMRLTSSGIGLHASKHIKRNPGTNGCIRLPYKISKTIFKNVRKGTKVSIVN